MNFDGLQRGQNILPADVEAHCHPFEIGYVRRKCLKMTLVEITKQQTIQCKHHSIQHSDSCWCFDYCPMSRWTEEGLPNQVS